MLNVYHVDSLSTALDRYRLLDAVLNDRLNDFRLLNYKVIKLRRLEVTTKTLYGVVQLKCKDKSSQLQVSFTVIEYTNATTV